MNTPTARTKLSVVSLIAAAAVWFNTVPASAQTNYYFDPSSSGSASSSNGTGTWDTGTIPDWYNGTSDVTFSDAIAGASGDTASNPGNANFDNSAGGTVTVNGTVNPYYLNFGGGNYDLVDGTSGLINFDFPNATGYYAGGYYGAFLNVNSGNVTFDAPIAINATSSTVQYGFKNTGSGTVTFNDGITFNSPDGDQLNIFNYGTGGNIVINGSVTNSSNAGVSIFSTGNLEFNGSIQGQIISVSGTLLVDQGSTYTGLVGQSGAVLTNGDFTVAVGLNMFTRYGGEFGGATAGVSRFESDLANYNGEEDLVAAAGGEVYFDGVLNGGGEGAGNNLIINGPGIVVLSSATGNSYAVQYYTAGGDAGVGTEVKSGATLLIENTSGSGTGGGAAQNVVSGLAQGSNNVVQVDAGAKFGGTGISQQNIVAMDGTTIITPGTMTAAGVSSIGTLHLDNGLTAINGLTVNFDFDATSNDEIEIESAFDNIYGSPLNGGAAIALDLAGTITFNLSGAIDPDGFYTLVYSVPFTTWDTSDATFVINGAPAGYEGVITRGYNIFLQQEQLNLSFQLAPEPSTWALIGCGALAAIGFGKLRRLRA